jgi:RecG-like helicase
MRKQVAAGHQAYVVYPVIEENEETELKAAIKMYRELSGKRVRRPESRPAAWPPRP